MPISTVTRRIPLRSVNLIFTWDENEVCVDVEDQGTSGRNAIPLETLRPDIETEKSGGRGIGIIKKFADKLEIEERLEGGLRVSITFRLRGQKTRTVVQR